MAEEGGEAHPWRGQPFDSYEGCLSLCQALGKIRGCGEGGCKPVSQLPQLISGADDQAVKVDRGLRGRVPVPVRAPVDQFSLGDGKADPLAGAPRFYQGVVFLKELDVAAIRCRRDSQGKIVHIGQGEAEGDLRVKTSNINDEQQRGDWGPVGGAHGYCGEDLRRLLEKKVTGPVNKEVARPEHQVRVDTLCAEHAAEGGGVDVVETSLDVKEKGRDLPFVHL